MLKLFFIAANDDNGENQDRLVWAADQEEAIRLANVDWGDEDGEFSGPMHDDCRIMEIDTTPRTQVGVVGWDLEKVDALQWI